MPRHDDDGSLSIRRSLIVWVVGAVLGWGVAVVAVYGIIRLDNEPKVAEEPRQQDAPLAEETERLNAISPAAGPEDSQPPAAEDR